MSLDGLSLLAVCTDLSALIGGRVEKIQQPVQDTLLFTIRTGGSRYKLLLCVHPQNGRVQLTEKSFLNPPEAYVFCMLLRKRIGSGRISRIEQLRLDRILIIHIEAYDELGDLVSYKLIIELMGKHSNICLLNNKDVIVDCIRHIGSGMTSIRFLMPGAAYSLPPSQAKINPLAASVEEFSKALGIGGIAHKILTAHFSGLSTECARQIVAKWSGEAELYIDNISPAEKEALAQYLFKLYQSFKEGMFSPTLLYNSFNEPIGIYPFEPLCPQGLCKKQPSMSAALDIHYGTLDSLERIHKSSSDIKKKLNNHLARLQKKLIIFTETLNQEADLEKFKLYGELVLSNMHLITRGMQFVKVLNFYNEPADELIIELDERMSPQENAQAFFKRYRKGKVAKSLASVYYQKTLEEIEYLEGQLDNLRKSTADEEFSEIRSELINEGYLKPEPVRRKPKKHLPTKPLLICSSQGHEIYVGRNNQQNEAITLRFAKGDDWWLHTKDIPGSHVIVRFKGELPYTTLQEAALLAAYFSRARNSASVPVDYCERKYVKKPSGAKPGRVIYSNHKTIYITPDEAKVQKLLNA